MASKPRVFQRALNRGSWRQPVLDEHGDGLVDGSSPVCWNTGDRGVASVADGGRSIGRSSHGRTCAFSRTVVLMDIADSSGSEADATEAKSTSRSTFDPPRCSSDDGGGTGQFETVRRIHTRVEDPQFQMKQEEGHANNTQTARLKMKREDCSALKFESGRSAVRSEGGPGVGLKAEAGAVKSESLRPVEWTAGSSHKRAADVVESGVLPANDAPLQWAVLRPSAQSEGAEDGEVRRRPRNGKDINCATAKQAPRPGERALKRLRSGVRGNPRAASNTTASVKTGDALEKVAAESRFRFRATGLLRGALGEIGNAETQAAALVDAFLAARGSKESRRLLLSLSAALRQNDALRAEALAMSPKDMVRLAHEEPREWASEAVREKRRQWEEEALLEVKPAGPVSVCPACGGRAVMHCGTAGSGRSGRLTKAFAHYSCMEDECGQEVHMKLE